MALKPPDMESCTPKVVCLGGVNNGTAYDPSDPCPGGFNFDSSACDCKTVFPQTGGYWRWSGTVTSTTPNGDYARAVIVISGPTGNESIVGEGYGSAQATGVTPWKFLPVNTDPETGEKIHYLPAMLGQDAPPTFDTEPNTWYALNASGSSYKRGSCNGGWSTGSPSVRQVSDAYDPNFPPPPLALGAYSMGFSISGSGSTCYGAPVGSLTTYSGAWQYSPNASESNITYEYDSDPYTPQNP
ncbi:hypothetical protein S-CBS2_gp035 [Synechococcus phage S-CBS2]|uniref:hypothetical protein n=1 Tax=Synechococcus phage S-CBS2 TaxID=753084 RepID=UPI00020783FC|nr:hypothetical protein S-CBS2_gp035 [Synechococcus phage S-CBS2]ADF42391.1 hypothetical protein S-CBS2_gp035 [Synechococcus phage S-CBS2]